MFHPPRLFILSKNSTHPVCLRFQSKLISHIQKICRRYKHIFLIYGSRFLHTTLTYYKSTKHSWFWWKFMRGKGWGDGYWKVNKMYTLENSATGESLFLGKTSLKYILTDLYLLHLLNIVYSSRYSSENLNTRILSGTSFNTNMINANAWNKCICLIINWSEPEEHILFCA